MKSICTVLLVFIFVAGYAQTGVIKIKKSGCDSLFIKIGYSHSDTLTFAALKDANFLFVQTRNCNQNASYQILSYSISINGAKAEMRKGPMYNFRQIPHSAELTTITITDCVIDDKVENMPAKKVLIPLTVFYVKE